MMTTAPNYKISLLNLKCKFVLVKAESTNEKWLESMLNVSKTESIQENTFKLFFIENPVLRES